MSKAKTIRPLEGYVKVSDADLVSAAPPFKPGSREIRISRVPRSTRRPSAAIEKLSALIAEALDGSHRVIAEKNKQREAVIKMLRLLARYVEVTCKDDTAR